MKAGTAQASTKAPQVYAQPELFIKEGGMVQLTWAGWENVAQVPSCHTIYLYPSIFLSLSVSLARSLFLYEYDLHAVFLLRRCGDSQVHDFTSFKAVSKGIRSGDPKNGGSFSHTFSTAGTYFFHSQIHDTLQVKINVMKCQYCTIISGYNGSHPRLFTMALHSRSPGSYRLSVSNYVSYLLYT